MTPPDEQDVTGEFATFYRRELARQVQRAALILGSASQANDVVHDAMIEVYRRWATIDRDFGEIPFDRDGMAVTVAFVPDDVVVTMPPWSEDVVSMSDAVDADAATRSTEDPGGLRRWLRFPQPLSQTSAVRASRTAALAAGTPRANITRRSGGES